MDPQAETHRGWERRLAEASGVEDLVEVLADRLTGADLTTVLLAAMRRRAGRVDPATLLHRYRTDRFVGLPEASFGALREVEDRMLAAIPGRFERVALSPLVPLGTHAALAPVDQNNVVATVRGSEVAADTTTGLALEAAARRRDLLAEDPRDATPVRLVAVQRVTRAQVFEEAQAYAHFSLLGLVTAGRDRGSAAFEAQAAAEHVATVSEAVLAGGADAVEVELTDWSGRNSRITDAIQDEVEGRTGVHVAHRPDRERGSGYYLGFCFKAFGRFGDTAVEVADGGLVDWTQQMLANRKERLMIGGIGLDRIALVLPNRRA